MYSMSGLRSFVGVLKVSTKIWGMWIPWLCRVFRVKRTVTILRGLLRWLTGKDRLTVFTVPATWLYSLQMTWAWSCFCFVLCVYSLYKIVSFTLEYYILWPYSSSLPFHLVPFFLSPTSSLDISLLFLCHIIKKKRFYTWEKTGNGWNLKCSHRPVLWIPFFSWLCYFAGAFRL